MITKDLLPKPIVYNPEEVSIDISGCESLWDPSLKDSVGIMDTERVVNGIAMKTLGESFNTEYLEVIQKAGDKLLELAPNIRILSQDQTQDYLVSGEISVAFLFTSQVAMALQANPNLKVVYPKEGLGLEWMHYLFLQKHRIVIMPINSWILYYKERKELKFHLKSIIYAPIRQPMSSCRRISKRA